MDIRRVGISDILESLPSLEPLQGTESLADFDLVLGALGFEDRACALIERLDRDTRLSDTRIVLFVYPTNRPENARNLATFESVVGVAGSLELVSYDRRTFRQAIRGLLNSLRRESRVLLDISVFASYLLFPTLRELFSRDIDLTLVYFEAASYFPTKDEWSKVAFRAEQERGRLFVTAFEEADFQSKGVDEVYPSDIFGERNPGNKPTMLVMVPNFSPVRASAIIEKNRELNKTQDQDVVWFIGEPPAKENKWRMAAIKESNRLEEVCEGNLKAVSTLDYQEMLEELEIVWLEGKSQFYLAIGDLGSKMQHVGTYFFMHIHPDVCLLLAEPRRFRAKRFSNGVGAAWKIEFGRTCELQRLLASYMEFKWKM